MSYILEALKKADQQRSRGEVPDIRASHLEESDRGRHRRLGMALVLLFLLIQGLLLFFYLREEAPAPVAARTEPASAPAQAAAPAPAPIPPAPTVPVAAGRPTAIVLEPPAPVEAARPVPAESTAPVRQAIEEVPELSLDTWQQGSAAVQQLGAKLSLDVHVYAEQPSQRFVLINMNRYREGDRLEEGAVLERITARGVVLSYRGEVFRYDRP